MTSEISIVTPTGTREDRPALLVSPSGTFTVVDLRGSEHKGTVGVFHSATGLRATPPRYFSKISNRKTAKALAEWLDELDPVEDDGSPKIEPKEYHRAFGEWAEENT